MLIFHKTDGEKKVTQVFHGFTKSDAHTVKFDPKFHSKKVVNIVNKLTEFDLYVSGDTSNRGRKGNYFADKSGYLVRFI